MRAMRLMGLFTAALAAAGCESITEAVSRERMTVATASATAERELPFRGSFEGQLSFVPPFDPGSVSQCNAKFSGDPAHPGPSVSGFDRSRGSFSFLGRVTLETWFCFDPEAPASRGEGTFTAGNGDKVFIAFENVSGVPDARGIVPVAGPQWITGGTGRFEGASGRQRCRLSVDATTLRIRGECEGEIRFDDAH
jgi:hypothetical protein